MSIKHRVKDRAADGKMRALWQVEAATFSRTYVKWGYVDYTKSPSRWNRVMNNIPKRRESSMLCRDIASGRRDAEGVIFPLANKPYIYYW